MVAKRPQAVQKELNSFFGSKKALSWGLSQEDGECADSDFYCDPEYD